MKLESTNEKRTDLSPAQRYIKLTRALVLLRILQGATELDILQKEKMESQLQEIRQQLGFSLQEFQQTLQDMEKNPEQSQYQSGLDSESEVEHRTAFCINRHCRHRFVVKINPTRPFSKRCPLCQSVTMFVMD